MPNAARRRNLLKTTHIFAMDNNKRREERVAVALPVVFDDTVGKTRDVSASGMFFEAHASFVVGEPINFAVLFDTRSGKRLLKCRGEIVRTESSTDGVGVAIRIADSTMGFLADSFGCQKTVMA